MVKVSFKILDITKVFDKAVIIIVNCLLGGFIKKGKIIIAIQRPMGCCINNLLQVKNSLINSNSDSIH
jgi:hypothetical protein